MIGRWSVSDFTRTSLSLRMQSLFHFCLWYDQDIYMLGPPVHGGVLTDYDLPPGIAGHPFKGKTGDLLDAKKVHDGFPSAIVVGEWAFLSDADLMLIKLTCE